jgi:predicted O-methyltransferase YrrM
MYRSTSYIPPLVNRAINLAEQMEYTKSCSPETGRLLQILASQYQSGVIAELGTGCGVGAAWIASALSPGTSFFTVELDVSQAAAVRALFDPFLNVRVIQGEWREFLRNWHFEMLFASRAIDRENDPGLLFESLRKGSLIVLDGLIPLSERNAKLKIDSLDYLMRDFWLNNTQVLGTEILISPQESVILATRID